jgi:hypothetical protein
MRKAFCAILVISMALYASAQADFPSVSHEHQATEPNQETASIAESAQSDASAGDPSTAGTEASRPKGNASDGDSAAHASQKSQTSRTHRRHFVRNFVIIFALGAVLYLLLGLAAK